MSCRAGRVISSLVDRCRLLVKVRSLGDLDTKIGGKGLSIGRSYIHLGHNEFWFLFYHEVLIFINLID